MKGERAPRPSASRRVGAWWPLVAVLLLAAALRFCRLDAQSLWNDEGTSVRLALRDLGTITRNASHDIHPPLYYYLLHFWSLLWGNSAVAARALSVLFGVATVVVTWALARPLSRRSAWLAGLLAACSPFMVYYSQEARMYMLLTLLAAGATWALAPLLVAKRPGASRVLLYAFLCLLLIYSHYLGFLLLAAHNLVWFITWVTKRRHGGTGPLAVGLWLAVQAGVAVCYLPWLLASWSALSSWPAVSATLSPGALYAQVVQTLAFGTTITQGPATLAAGTAIFCLALAGLLPHPPERRRDAPDTDAVTWRWTLWAALLVPIALILLLSLRRPMYKAKFILLASPFYWALVAQGIVTLGERLAAGAKRWVAPTVVVLLTCLPLTGAALALGRLYYDPTYARDDYRGLVQYITAASGPNDAILINAPSQIETVDYYYRGPLPLVPLPLQRPLDRAVTAEQLERLVAAHPRIYAIYWATAESDPQGFIETWLASHCFEALDTWFGNLRLVVYAVPQQPSPTIQHPLAAELGGVIGLCGYSLLSPTPASGDIVQLTLYWQALSAIDQRYKVFVHLVDARGNIVAQRDSEPGGGLYPTTNWQPGETVSDNYGVLVRAGTAPGVHTLRVGLYDAATGERLAVTRREDSSAAEGADALDLAEIRVLSAAAPPPLAALDMDQRVGATWPGLSLLGYSVHKLGFAHAPATTLYAGDLVELVLFWQREPAEGANTYDLALIRGGQKVWAQTLRITDGEYPLTDWQPGEVVRDAHVLGLPADIRPGGYDLWVESRTLPQQSFKLRRLVISPQSSP
jgi:hypothetical protein